MSKTADEVKAAKDEIAEIIKIDTLLYPEVYTNIAIQAVGNRIEELTNEIHDIKENGITIKLQIDDNCSENVKREKIKRIIPKKGV